MRSLGRDRGAELGRDWLDQRERALSESRGRCTRCGSPATHANVSLNGSIVARCRPCYVVDVAAMARRTEEPRGRRSPRASVEASVRTAAPPVSAQVTPESGGPEA